MIDPLESIEPAEPDDGDPFVAFTEWDGPVDDEAYADL